MTADALLPRVQTALDAFIVAKRTELSAISPQTGPLLDALVDLVSGGKRMRPAFAYWGHLGAGGEDGDAIVRVGAALELFQASALLHDDVMDGSDTRRGRPAAHVRFAALHREQQWRRGPDAFGAAAAILLGDLCLAWSTELLGSSGFADPALGRARGVFATMSTEVMTGQFLDVLGQARGDGTVEDAMHVVRFKAAKYTIERPLHLGGVLAGAGEDVLQTYTAFGLPLGEAFQLRDDLLGVFGDPAQTGKPAGDDLREGKGTALVAAALEVADDAQSGVVRRLLGDPELDERGVTDLRTVLVDTGAVDRVEAMVGERLEQALAALAAGTVTAPARTALEQLAVAATTRLT